MKSVKENLLGWLNVSNERIKTQRFYLLISIFAFLAAGIASLFDDNSDRILLLISISSLAIFATNFIVWTLGVAIVEKIGGK